MEEVRALARLAWPAIVGQLGMMGMGVVDLWVVGALGRSATAAVGIGNTLAFGSLVLAMGAVHGADGVVAQAWGAGRPRVAGLHAARVGLVAALLSVPVMAVHLLAGPLLEACRQPASVVPLAATYVGIRALGVPASVGFSVVRQLVAGNGIVRPAMLTVLLANVVNLAGAVLFVRVLGFGVGGAAAATVIVQWVMFGSLVAMVWPILREARPDAPVLAPGALREAAAKAIPVGFQIGLEVWAFNVGFFVAGALGDAEAAAHTIAMTWASLSFMVPLGLSSAAATRVGNQVGRAQPWERAAWTAVALGAGAMTLSATAFFAIPAPLARVYSDDPVVVALVVAVLPVAAVFQLFDGTQGVSFGVFRGLDDLRVPALFNVVGYWLVGLPLAGWLVFGLGLGLPGLWAGYTVALGIVASLLVGRLALRTRRSPAPT